MPGRHRPKTAKFGHRYISGYRDFGPGTEIFQPRCPAGTGQQTVKFKPWDLMVDLMVGVMVDVMLNLMVNLMVDLMAKLMVDLMVVLMVDSMMDLMVNLMVD